MDQIALFISQHSGLLYELPVLFAVIMFRELATHVSQSEILLCRIMTVRTCKRMAAILVTFLLFRLAGELLKSAFAMPRPCWDTSSPSLITCPNTFAFPSGHTLGAFFVAAFSGLLFRKKTVWVFGIILACLVGWSRIAVGVHTSMDILGGAMIGVVGAYSTWRLYWNER